MHELHDARQLVGGHVVVRPVDDVLLGHLALAPGLQHDDGLHRLAAVRVVGADDARLLDRLGCVVQHRLDLGRPDLVAGGVDHALEAIDEEEVALVVVAAEVAGAEERLAVELDEACGRGLGVVPVALEAPAARARRSRRPRRAAALERVRIDHQRIGVEDRDAEALLLGPVRRVACVAAMVSDRP